MSISIERISSSRHNVLYIAFAELLFSITFLIMGIVLWYTLGEQILDVDAVALDLHLFAYFFLGLATMLGISGALNRSRPLVAMFCSMTLAQLIFGLGSGIYCLTILFDDPGDLITAALRHKCATMDHFSKSFCERTPTIKFFTFALFMQVWVIQLIGVYCSQMYLQELIDEEEAVMKEMDYEYDYNYAYYG
ncbi:hypothetical protein BDP27DRAFT_1403550 [Rhodocollybia butyracea]|uniref:Uncharacterized protein n=1 Tax=Rhodocollybia butyracea TaxID=206335 RepID=A0A9P5U6N9_9AGAR|nr:hypothetical protein BDP27DRAFT_1403550 [Rhodocollybia butyracea]